MRFVDGEERDRHALKPSDRILARQALGREIQEPVCAGARVSNHDRLLARRHRAIQNRCRNAHLGQLRGLILHQGDQGRDYYRGASHRERGKLVAERFPAAGRHDDAYVAPGQNAADDALLDGTKPVVAPISAQRSEEVDFRGQATIVASDYSPRRIIVAPPRPSISTSGWAVIRPVERQGQFDDTATTNSIALKAGSGNRRPKSEMTTRTKPLARRTLAWWTVARVD